MSSSSEDDCYVNSAKALKAMKKKLAVNTSTLDEPPASPEDGLSLYIPDECMMSESPPPARKPKKKPARRSRRNTRRNVNLDNSSDDEKNMPELFAKKKPSESVSLVDSDADDIFVTSVPKVLDTTGDDADENYEMTIKINWQSARVERVPLRRYQEFSAVFEYFSNMAKVPRERIWLVLRNTITIQPSDTPDSLGISIVDIIEGGIIDGVNEHQTVTTTNVVDKDSITIKLQTKDHKKSLSISIKKTQKIKVLLMKCAEQLKVPEDKIKFQFDGEEVELTETPDSLDLEGGECFDMYIAA